jgi:integrase/recombinase XerD
MSCSITAAIAEFLAHRRLREVNATTLTLYERKLTTWQAWHRGQHGSDELAAVTAMQFRAYFSYLRDEHIPQSLNPKRPAVADQVGLAPASREQTWKILSAFWRFCAGERWLSEEQREFFANGRIPRPPVPEQYRKALDDVTYAALLATCADTEEGWRDRAIMTLMAESGMRIGELVALNDVDIDQPTRTAYIAVGKGGKFRFTFYRASAQAAIAAYLEVRRSRGAEAERRLFRAVTGPTQGIRVSADGMREMLHRRAQLAGVNLAQGAPAHWFRHRFARWCLREGVDSLHVQQLLGHASIAMTLRYAREEAAMLRKIYQQHLDSGDVAAAS